MPHVSSTNRIIRNKKNQKERKIKKEDIVERKSKKQNKGKERNKKESMQTYCKPFGPLEGVPLYLEGAMYVVLFSRTLSIKF
jgi:hypothetical protein